ncbi:MAG: GTP cyclohydrolase FolE2 [Thermaerobacter sp.]|nr:GTP cyclohydrolase FolE2 [Thermaerobacter sp.]
MLSDVQNRSDHRGVDIQEVGIKRLSLPLLIKEKEGGFQSVTGYITAAVELTRRYKGTHMSRFVEVLETWGKRSISNQEVEAVLRSLAARLEARRTSLALTFRYFLPKRAPVSGHESMMGYPCRFEGRLDGERFEFVLGVSVPVVSLCPCSKEISRYGAHNQRAVIRVRLRQAPRRMLWLEDLIRLLELQGSAPIYPLLKREDEKAVTEKSYENPKFVEDILRDTIIALREDPRVAWFEAECESYESIHDHSAFAYHREGLDEGWPYREEENVFGGSSTP